MEKMAKQLIVSNRLSFLDRMEIHQLSFKVIKSKAQSLKILKTNNTKGVSLRLTEFKVQEVKGEGIRLKKENHNGTILSKN